MRDAMAGARSERGRAREPAQPHRGGAAAAPAAIIAPEKFIQPSRRTFFGGFAAGSVVSAALAASLTLTVLRND